MYWDIEIKSKFKLEKANHQLAGLAFMILRLFQAAIRSSLAEVNFTLTLNQYLSFFPQALLACVDTIASFSTGVIKLDSSCSSAAWATQLTYSPWFFQLSSHGHFRSRICAPLHPSISTFALNAESTYDWRNDHWSIPINFNVLQLLKIGPQIIQVGVGARYWAASPETGPEDWAARVQLTFLFPNKDWRTKNIHS